MKNPPSIHYQNKRNIRDLSLLKRGKITFHRYTIEPPQADIDIEHIKKIREEILHVSQKVLADGLGVSVRTVQGWEGGRSRPIGPARRLLSIIEKMPAARKMLIPV